MAENQDGLEKKHDPGEKKWREAAEKGNIARSSDLASGAVVFGAAMVLTFGTDWVTEPITALARRMFLAVEFRAFDQESAVGLLQESLWATAAAVIVPLGMAMVVGTMVHLAQSQAQWASKALEPKWDRLNPIDGIKNQYMSWTPVVELGKGVAKIGALGTAGYFAVESRLGEIPAMAFIAPSELYQIMIELGWMLVLASTPIVLLIGAADYAYSAYQLTENLKRTDQELKDDRKQTDGDPRFKAQRRQMARKMLVGGGLGQVRLADVVVTNPTHYAIALRYDRDKDIAPIVVAKGVDLLAQKIRREALRCGVPRVEDRPLARALYAKVELNMPIPESLYRAVAKVLAVIQRRRMRSRQPPKGPRPVR